jgi:hypothetical protein
MMSLSSIFAFLPAEAGVTVSFPALHILVTPTLVDKFKVYQRLAIAGVTVLLPIWFSIPTTCISHKICMISNIIYISNYLYLN